MKFSCFALIALLFCSCTRYELESDSHVGDGSNRLIIQVSPFEQTGFGINPASRGLVSVDKVCTRLGFAAFDEQGKKVASVNQDTNTGSCFGTFQADLNDGIYDIVIVGHSTNGNATIAKPDSIRFADNKLTDTFAYHTQLTLSGNLTKEITMQRSVTMFRLNLKEKIPTNVKQLKFYYTGGSSALNAVTNLGRIQSRQTELRDVPANAYTSADNIFEIYTIPHTANDELKITITALAEDGKTELYEKVFENVPISQGKITTYKGTLFNISDDDQPQLAPLKYIVTAEDYWTEETYTF